MLQIIQLSAYVFAGARTTECIVQHSDLRIILLFKTLLQEGLLFVYYQESAYE